MFTYASVAQLRREQHSSLSSNGEHIQQRGAYLKVTFVRIFPINGLRAISPQASNYNMLFPESLLKRPLRALLPCRRGQ